MATKNLRKALRWGDLSTFTVNASKVPVYLANKKESKIRNAKFKEYYVEFRTKGYDKKEAKKLTKARLKTEAAA